MRERLVVGLAGERLTPGERRLLAAHPPLGVILFARNVGSPAQVRALIHEVRDATGCATWAAVDEEGGRVNRMPWPPFSGRREAAELGERYRRDPAAAVRAATEEAFAVGLALADLGFTHDCAPVLDLFHPTGDAIIGRRAYAADPETVAALGAAVTRGLAAAGVEAVGKHFPGHGRADADSHTAIPHVDASLDTLLAEAAPFEILVREGLGHVMTAHVVYDAADVRPATFSRYWLADVLRGRFGFAGRIWSDDLCMRGAGSDVARAAARARDAGCDVLLVCEPEAAARLLATG